MRIFCLIVLLVGWYAPIVAINYYVDATAGDDDQSGLSTGEAFATLGRAIAPAGAGDTIFLLPGVYPGKNYVLNKPGAPDRPMVITSYATDPLEYAVIDAQQAPASDVGWEGIGIINSSWVNIENLVFRNCWTNVIPVVNSSYITVRNCHFTSGKRQVYPRGHDAHHVLVAHCYVRYPSEVWQGWSWETLHHGELEYYNGALLHPRGSGGGHVMRSNTLINLFNGFRTWAEDIREDGNTEVYSNTLINIRDNDFEPERWAWNIHYYHNRHRNIHKAYSIDNVQGGNIYIYGNTYTQTTDAWALEEVSGIFKYKNGPLTYPCYAFNNSYHTEAKVLKEGEATNHQLRHFNNAYYFFQGANRFRVTDWQPGYAFDFDCINQSWPPNILDHDQEIDGLQNTDIQFVNGAEGDFHLAPGSPGIDAGIVLELPEFEWTQRYAGAAPDLGAYEGLRPVDGPPFRFIPSPQGAFYNERPRITRHRTEANVLVLYFSAALDSNSVTATEWLVYRGGEPVAVDSLGFPGHAYELYLYTGASLSENEVTLDWDGPAAGQNGLPITRWASTIPIGISAPTWPDLSVIPEVSTAVEAIPAYHNLNLQIIPNPARGRAIARLRSDEPLAPRYVDRLTLYDRQGDDLAGYHPVSVDEREATFEMDLSRLPAGLYVARVRVGKRVVSASFVVD